jgi:hypothetical protein
LANAHGWSRGAREALAKCELERGLQICVVKTLIVAYSTFLCYSRPEIITARNLWGMPQSSWRGREQDVGRRARCAGAAGEPKLRERAQVCGWGLGDGRKIRLVTVFIDRAS